MTTVRHLGLVAVLVATAGSALAQPQAIILTPPAAATTPFEVAGYAYDPRATVDPGIAELQAFIRNTVFVTSATYTGDLVTEAANAGLGDFTGDGLGAGDALCNDLARTAGLPGTYKAWLSDSTNSPSTTFVQSSIPYARVDGAVVASSWQDLTDGVLQAPIRITESNNFQFDLVWTGTNTDGTAVTPSNACGQWSQGGSVTGLSGFSGDTGRTWTIDSAGHSCGNESNLYCFEQ